MALHPKFPKSPHAILDPETRWFPAAESMRDKSMDKLMPPLVASLRKEVKLFRDNDYLGASETSKSLLHWWFSEHHLLPNQCGLMSEFQYFFAQREAIETVIFLVDSVKALDKYDLIRYDRSGVVNENNFDETWLRLVIKMATGSGKTKVMSLALAWSYFHKLYEPESRLARNFLVIAPNIIVLDRIFKDFAGFKIFNEDPILPDNGYQGRNWQNDFQLTLHKQDEVHSSQAFGNIFLTNIQRVYSDRDIPPSADDENTMDYFLGKRPTGGTTDSKIDLGAIVRNVDELMIINDEAHHVHDPSLVGFKSIQDIHNHLLQKGSFLSLQLDVTATPKHTNGTIFVQTIVDYPLVEAIHQNVVKHPVLPDKPSREKLKVRQRVKYSEKFSDFLKLGVIEWRKSNEVHQKLGKKAILFVMTDDTRNCDEVAEYLEANFPDLNNSVLVIHTKNNGDISEPSTGKAKDELEKLRKQANEIDSDDNQIKAIVSVLMLKEGWDVKNVTTIVGLRAYSAKSNILPEQTLGRGLRKMYPGFAEEYLSVVGTDPFMDFIDSIQAEGVELIRKPMDEEAEPIAPLLIEVDFNNFNKNIDDLDIEIPLLPPRVYRDFKNLADLEPASFEHDKIQYKLYPEDELREIVFAELTTGEITHSSFMDDDGITDYRDVIGWFTRQVMKELRLFSFYDILYSKLQDFIANHLFSTAIDLDDQNTMCNLSELEITQTIHNTFKNAINNLTITPQKDNNIINYIRLKNMRPFIVKDQEYIIPKKSVFNKIIGDSGFELEFATFLDNCHDVIAYAKNYISIKFYIEYVNSLGNLSNYYPDFFVKLSDNSIFIVETKGREELDLPLKMSSLASWCKDINSLNLHSKFDFLFVDQVTFNESIKSEQISLSSFHNLVGLFTRFKD